ncbi:MAG: hypothetical protein ACRERE_25990 [Candidatus Entotheonellia bacterium]
MRHSSLHLKRRAAVLINALVAVIVLMGATAPLSAQEPLNLMNPLSSGLAFTEATLAAAVRGIGTAVACTDIPCQNIVLETNEIHAEGVARPPHPASCIAS